MYSEERFYKGALKVYAALNNQLKKNHLIVMMTKICLERIYDILRIQPNLCPGSSLDFDFWHWNRTDPTEDIRLFLCLNPGQGIV